MGPNLLKGHLWDSLDEIEEIYQDTSRRIFTLSLINQIVCILDAHEQAQYMENVENATANE